MKIISFILLVLLFSPAYADVIKCAASAIRLYPEQQEISVKSRFIIEGYMMGQKKVREFEHRKVYLESVEGERTELELIEIIEGQMFLSQALFKAIQPLKPNTEYVLTYQNMTEEEEREQFFWNHLTGERERKNWTTVSKTASLDPAMEINLKETRTEWLGCGPAANAIFTTSPESAVEIWYRTEFLDVKTGKLSYFYLTEWRSELRVGHGMCSGAFIYRKEGAYKVRFTPVSPAGQKLQTSDWYSFKSPFEGTRDPRGI